MKVCVEVGKCKTCKYAVITKDDPSPAGISLSAGYYTYIDCEHSVPDSELHHIEEAMKDKHECKFWEPYDIMNNIIYCEKHGWGAHDLGQCSKCMYEEYIEMNEKELNKDRR